MDLSGLHGMAKAPAAGTAGRAQTPAAADAPADAQSPSFGDTLDTLDALGEAEEDSPNSDDDTSLWFAATDVPALQSPQGAVQPGLVPGWAVISLETDPRAEVDAERVTRDLEDDGATGAQEDGTAQAAARTPAVMAIASTTPGSVSDATPAATAPPQQETQSSSARAAAGDSEDPSEKKALAVATAQPGPARSASLDRSDVKPASQTDTRIVAPAETFGAAPPAAGQPLEQTTTAGDTPAELVTAPPNRVARAAEPELTTPSGRSMRRTHMTPSSTSFTPGPASTTLPGIDAGAADTSTGQRRDAHSSAQRSMAADELARFVSPIATRVDSTTESHMELARSLQSALSHPAVSASPLARAVSVLSTVANGAASPLAALAAETTTQIVQTLRLQVSQGGGTAHIRLEPQHLGELHVTIKVEQGQVVARVEAEAPAVREWLQSNQSWLRQSLADQRLTLDRLDVAETRESRHEDTGLREQSQGGARREQQAQSRRRRPDVGELFEVVA